MLATHSFFATCPKGLESLLLEELRSLGGQSLKETVAGVHFSAPLATAYRCCLWSRLANKILLPLAEFKQCEHIDDVYSRVRTMAWAEHLSADGSLAIEFFGRLKGLKHTHYAALKAKDAIADYFQERCGRRPSVKTDEPDLRIQLHAGKGKLTISIDLAGASLHKRGYRQSGGAAPLKENLAAALLMRADWPGIAAQGGALIDPMCGSGTLLIEAALMAMGIAPALQRRHWGFSGWLGHAPDVWSALLSEAQALRDGAFNRQWPEIRGYDANPNVIRSAEDNILRAGLDGKVRVIRKELAKLVKPTHTTMATGLVISNPPYGERLGEESSLLHLYRCLGQRLKEQFVGWHAAVFTGNPDLGKRMGLRSHKQYQLFNGAIPSKLLLFHVQETAFVDDKKTAHSPANTGRPDTLSDGAQMFANRLKKNLKQLDKWHRQHEIECYRIYDADMPEYAVAIDRYADWVNVAEYKPPANIDSQAAARRLDEVMSALPVVLGISPDNVVLKQRQRQKGSSQYHKRDHSRQMIEVREGQVKLLVNLRDYLDTGLFLDHRPVRLKIAECSKGKRFLNLFAYTGAATVHAAVGGAKWTDSVDLSPTYLEWSRKNLLLNGLDETRHRLHRADCREWIKHCDKQYDLILLDPPTFSNSKKMQGIWDIQRDHVALINDVMQLLAADGLLIFSNNHRKFTLDTEALSGFAIEDKTSWSLDRDFQRSKKIHQCWFIRH